MKDKGKLFIVSAASGTGKSSLIKEGLKLFSSYELSVSYTTRSPRSGEENGIHYYFVSKEEFFNIKERGDFLECALVHGNHYGTSKSLTESKLSSGMNLILEIDVQGYEQILGHGLDHESIFILPPSYDVLKNRLTTRGSNDDASIQLRLDNAKGELKKAYLYKHLIVNDNFDDCLEKFIAILRNENQTGLTQNTELFLEKLLSSWGN
ncbi:MAG: Gmk: guanylate kinase [Pseudomonadota bacterium]